MKDIKTDLKNSIAEMYSIGIISERQCFDFIKNVEDYYRNKNTLSKKLETVHNEILENIMKDVVIDTDKFSKISFYFNEIKKLL